MKKSKRIEILSFCLSMVILAVLILSTILLIKNHQDNQVEFISLRNQYRGGTIALELGEDHTVDFDELISDKNLIYDKASLVETENYKVKDKTLTPTREGIFSVILRLEYSQKKIIYHENVMRVICYDITKFVQINTVEDLCKMNDKKEGHYILNADLDLKDIENFQPIGNFPINNVFSGIFINPNGYVIKNLTIKTSTKIPHSPSGGCAGALFGSTRNAYIDNIILEDVSIDVSDCDSAVSYGAGLVAVDANSLITNCKVTGKISATLYAGGIVGCADYTSLKNNLFIGTVIQKNGDLSDRPSAGGLAGWLTCCSIGQENFASDVFGNIVAAKIQSETIAGKIAGLIQGDRIRDNMIYCEVSAPEVYETGRPIKPTN